jgi:hypothetical protein
LNATGIVKCHVVEKKDVARHQGKQQVSSTEKMDRRPCALYGSLSSTDAVVAISVEDGRECTRTLRLYPSVLRATGTSLSEAETPVPSSIIVFASPKVTKGSISTMDRKLTLKISVFGAQRI